MTYQRIISYQGKIKKEATVRLREPAIIPEEVLENELQEKRKRFAYMVEE